MSEDPKNEAKIELDIEDIAPRAQDVDEATADDVSGGWFKKVKTTKFGKKKLGKKKHSKKSGKSEKSGFDSISKSAYLKKMAKKAKKSSSKLKTSGKKESKKGKD